MAAIITSFFPFSDFWHVPRLFLYLVVVLFYPVLMTHFMKNLRDKNYACDAAQNAKN